MVDVRYILTEQGMRYDVISPAKILHAHILLPEGKACRSLLVNGSEAVFVRENVGDSAYVNADLIADKKISVEILF